MGRIHPQLPHQLRHRYVSVHGLLQVPNSVKEQEHAVAVPAVRDHLRRVKSVWKDVRTALVRSAERNKRLAGLRRSPAPEYKVSLLKPVSILDVRPRGRGYQYRVDWEAYGPEERSWIFRKLILDDSLLSDFYAAHPGEAWEDTGRRPLRGEYRHEPSCSTTVGAWVALCAISSSLSPLPSLSFQHLFWPRSCHQSALVTTCRKA
ncbi:uncharacterized protein LOC133471037 [Phyllopteryx taeniolatus]|uniref:uncharacterized protein LOC133471037 n=1 Tax=Phyllopteryx taeniolatus TaxID=161469 RepID=UPI002AD316C7|nr:uncharacterized protein LOC133471037 [Phyllopteryx taeniolatus]